MQHYWNTLLLKSSGDRIHGGSDGTVVTIGAIMTTAHSPKRGRANGLSEVLSNSGKQCGICHNLECCQGKNLASSNGVLCQSPWKKSKYMTNIFLEVIVLHQKVISCNEQASSTFCIMGSNWCYVVREENLVIKLYQMIVVALHIS